MKLYVIGSLRNPEIPRIAEKLRALGYEVFDDWFAPGPTTDDSWKEYEVSRGHNLEQALQGHAAKNVFNFDKKNIDAADAVIMVMPAGKSGHLELGYAIGKGKLGYVLFDSDPDRWDVMLQFATKVFFSYDKLVEELNDKKSEYFSTSGAINPTSSIKNFRFESSW